MGGATFRFKEKYPTSKCGRFREDGEEWEGDATVGLASPDVSAMVLRL